MKSCQIKQAKDQKAKKKVIVGMHSTFHLYVKEKIIYFRKSLTQAYGIDTDNI